MVDRKIKFSDFIAKYKNKKIAIGIHRHADLDALCSAYALSTIFSASAINSPDEMNSEAKHFAEKFGINVFTFNQIKKEEFEGMIIVDCGSYVMIEEARKWNVLCIVDHHQKSPEKERIMAELEILDANACSTAQIISNILPEINEKAAFALAVGIVADTARFRNGSVQTFEELTKLLKISEKGYGEVLEYAEPEKEADEKMQIVSAFRNAEMHVYKNFVIATTVVSTKEGESSSALSDFADIAFAGSWKSKENETRISARARKHVPIKLNEVMVNIGMQFSGTGGGHIKAAGANAKVKPEVALAACIDATKDALDKI